MKVFCQILLLAAFAGLGLGLAVWIIVATDCSMAGSQFSPQRFARNTAPDERCVASSQTESTRSGRSAIANCAIARRSAVAYCSSARLDSRFFDEFARGSPNGGQRGQDCTVVGELRICRLQTRYSAGRNNASPRSHAENRRSAGRCRNMGKSPAEGLRVRFRCAIYQGRAAKSRCRKEGRGHDPSGHRQPGSGPHAQCGAGPDCGVCAPGGRCKRSATAS